MSIERLLEDMENMLVDATRVPLTNKLVLEEDEIAQFIDELREMLPKEIFESRRIVSERQRILEEAQTEAQNIIDNAKKFVGKLTDEHIIARQAEEQANFLVAEARKTAQELRGDSINYASDVFNHLVMNIERTLDTVKSAQRELQQSQKNSRERDD